MRILGFAVVLALSGVARQASAPDRLVVVLDGDAPAADAPAAARLRAALLAQLDPSGSAAYFELTAERLSPVPAADSLGFRAAVFTVTRRPSGVAVTFGESVEALRGNDFARDTAIARECGPWAPDCAGGVRAAMESEVRYTEAVSRQKLRRLAAGAAAWRGARVVIVTAGWPTRDDGRVDLRGALRDLRAAGVSLAVVRVPPREAYRGLVRDASESLAAQLPARFAVLAGEPDVASVASMVGEGPATAIASAPAGPTSAPGVPAPVAPAPADAADASTLPQPGDALAESSGLDAVLRRAAAYVARFERTFTNVLWHERYEQEDRVWRRFASSGASTSTVAARRTLESELFFAWLPQDRTWIAVRDVVSVDGQPRPESDRRLPALASRSTVSLLELRDLARENGRFNVGQIVRTFNEPTLALLFLDERTRDGVRFSRKEVRRVDGRRIATYAFVERGRPTVIRSADRDLPARGTLEVDEGSGEIQRTTLDVADPQSGLTGTMAVTYQRHVAFDVLVPHEMRETYLAVGREQVTATAIYSDFRRFQTTARIILTP